jgi:hypothetical protein
LRVLSFRQIFLLISESDLFTNYVHPKPTEEFLEFLSKQGIAFEQFKQARQPISEAHNRQETPASIERAALKKK